MGRVFQRASAYRLEAFPASADVSPLPSANSSVLIGANLRLNANPFTSADLNNGFAVVYRGNTGRTNLDYSVTIFDTELWVSTIWDTGELNMKWSGLPTFAQPNRYNIAVFAELDSAGSCLFINGVDHGGYTATTGFPGATRPGVTGGMPCIVGAQRSTASTIISAFGGIIQDVLVGADIAVDVPQDKAAMQLLSLGWRPTRVVNRFTGASTGKWCHIPVMGRTPEPSNCPTQDNVALDPQPASPLSWTFERLPMKPSGTRPWNQRGTSSVRGRGMV